MENGECGEPRGIVKNALHILVMTSAKQQPLGRIFSMHSPSIRTALSVFSVFSRGMVTDVEIYPLLSL